jgi:hypothetical protein
LTSLNSERRACKKCGRNEEDDPLLAGKIASAHLSEFPDYYPRLAKMENEADQF